MGKKKKPPIIQAPNPYADLIDEVCARDREWFEAHPEQSQYLRPFVPGEFWPDEPDDTNAVRVTLIGPGARVRQPCKIVDPDQADHIMPPDQVWRP